MWTISKSLYWICYNVACTCLFCGPEACGTLTPWPGTESQPPALERLSLNHWTAREPQLGVNCKGTVSPERQPPPPGKYQSFPLSPVKTHRSESIAWDSPSAVEIKWRCEGSPHPKHCISTFWLVILGDGGANWYSLTQAGTFNQLCLIQNTCGHSW